MTRRCSHCGNNGHNARTCPTRGSSACGGGVRLFGVRLTDGSIIKKSASMGNLSALSAAHHHLSPLSSAVSPNRESPDHARGEASHVTDGYLSDDPIHGSGSTNRFGERKKGTPWTEEEHRLFLIGLRKLGKGDWRGIARNYVMSRTPTQVASHAQKYFNRQTNTTRRKRRSSLFDMVPDNMVLDTPAMPEQALMPSPKTDNEKLLPSLDLSLNSEFEPIEAPLTKEFEETVFFPAYLSIPYHPVWFPNTVPLDEEKGLQHQILKPTPVLAKEPVNVDELGLSQLCIQEADRGQREPSPLSLKLLGSSSRLSAFRTNAPPVNGNKSNKAIQAI